MRLTWGGKLIFRNKMRPQRQGPCSTVSMETGEDAREILVVTHTVEALRHPESNAESSFSGARKLVSEPARAQLSFGYVTFYRS